MIPKIIRTGLEVTSGNILQKGFAVVNILMLSGFLEISHFGLFMLTITIINVSAQLATFSLPNVVYKLIGMHAKDGTLAGELSNVLFSALATSVLLCAVLLTFSARLSEIFLDSSQTSNLQFALIIIISSTLTSVSNSILVGLDQARKSVLVSIVEVGTRTAGLLALTYLHGSIKQAVMVYIASSVISLCTSIFFARDILKKMSFHPSLPGIRKTLSMGRSFFVSSLAVILIFNVDRLMLGAMTSPDQVGIFVLAAALANTILIVHSSLTTLFKPYAASAKKHEDLKALQKAYFSVLNWSFLLNGILFLFLNIFSLYIISAFFHVENGSSLKNLLLVLSINALMYVSVGPSTTLLQMSGGHRKEILNTIVFVISNAVLNIYLIPKWGALGAALATSIACLLRLTMQVHQIHSMLSFYVVNRRHLLTIVLLIGAAIALHFLWLPLILQVAIFALYCLIEAYRTYTNPERLFVVATRKKTQ